MDQSRRKLVIVPAYNEAESIGALVDELAQRLGEYDLLIINDGSTDDTAGQVPKSARVVSLPFNLGIGAAMQAGYRFAAIHGYDLAVQVDGDGQHPPDQVARLVEHLHGSGADLVIGSRFLEPGRYDQSAMRAAGTGMLRSVLNMLTGKQFTDCTSGFRAANRRVIHAFAQWYPDDYPEPEVILLLHRAGYRIEEVPVRMNQRVTGKTSIPHLHGLFYVIKVIFALLLDMIRQPWRT
jgi:hypothetical protein